MSSAGDTIFVAAVLALFAGHVAGCGSGSSGGESKVGFDAGGDDAAQAQVDAPADSDEIEQPADTILDVFPSFIDTGDSFSSIGEAKAQDAAEVGPCALAVLAGVFDAQVRPHLTTCKSCHDMTVPQGMLKAPGPQWYHPTDSSKVVAFLLDNGLVDSKTPALSKFMLKPLAVSDGGLKHTGGDVFTKDSPAYDGFLTFLTAAAPCVPAKSGARGAP